MFALDQMEPTGSEAGLTVATILVIVAIYVILAVALWRVFTKAGRAGILGLIPIVNLIVLVQIAGYAAWMAVLYLIPVVNVVFHVLVSLRLGQAFGKGALFSLLWIWLFSVIGLLMIGFGQSRYSREAIAV